MRCLLIFLLIPCCLIACVEQPQKKTAFNSTLSTVQAPDLSFPAGTRFSWSPETSHLFQDSRLDNANIYNALRESVENELFSRGYQIVTRGQYNISYVAALEKSLSDQEIDSRFGINPGLRSKQQDGQVYEKGTVIIDVADPLTQTSLWRSAMQGYVEFGLSKSVRSARIKKVVETMFMSFPRGK